jgi:hypothetical protein
MITTNAPTPIFKKKTIAWWMVELPLVLTSQLLIIPSQGHLQVK